MKTINIKPYVVANQVTVSGTVPVQVLSWYQNANFWISILISVSGIIGDIQKFFPKLSWTTTALGVIGVLITVFQKVVPSSSQG